MPAATQAKQRQRSEGHAYPDELSTVDRQCTSSRRENKRTAAVRVIPFPLPLLLCNFLSLLFLGFTKDKRRFSFAFHLVTHSFQRVATFQQNFYILNPWMATLICFGSSLILSEHDMCTDEVKDSPLVSELFIQLCAVSRHLKNRMTIGWGVTCQKELP